MGELDIPHYYRRIWTVTMTIQDEKGKKGYFSHQFRQAVFAHPEADSCNGEPQSHQYLVSVGNDPYLFAAFLANELQALIKGAIVSISISCDVPVDGLRSVPEVGSDVEEIGRVHFYSYDTHRGYYSDIPAFRHEDFDENGVYTNTSYQAFTFLEGLSRPYNTHFNSGSTNLLGVRGRGELVESGAVEKKFRRRRRTSRR